MMSTHLRFPTFDLWVFGQYALVYKILEKLFGFSEFTWIVVVAAIYVVCEGRFENKNKGYISPDKYISPTKKWMKDEMEEIDRTYSDSRLSSEFWSTKMEWL